MKTLFCDFDDVICCNKIIELGNEFLGTNLTFEDVGEGYDYSKYVPESEKQTELCKYIIEHNMYNGSTLKKDCYKVLKYLQEKCGYEIFILSSCLVDGKEELCGQIFKDKYDYILKNLPFIKPRNIIFTASKHIASGDVMIDDRLSNLGGNFKTKLLFEACYNKKYSNEELKKQNVNRVKNWAEIKKLLEKN